MSTSIRGSFMARPPSEEVVSYGSADRVGADLGRDHPGRVPRGHGDAVPPHAAAGVRGQRALALCGDAVPLGPGVEDEGNVLPPPDDDPLALGRPPECRAPIEPDEGSPGLPLGACRLLPGRHRVLLSGTRAGPWGRRA